MDKIKMMAIIVMVVASNVLFIGCGDKSNPTGPGNNSTKKDTSIFLGKWVQVFDTNDVNQSKKDQKLKFWRAGLTFISPDTFTFVNDSLYSDKNGLDSYYKYSKDSISWYSWVAGGGSLEFLSTSSYYLSNDTLVFNPDTAIYSPICLRISK